EKLVTSIPEEDWREGVEIVGWMYQYYVSERKDEVFASFKKGKKAERESIAPATQLFTPNWIVRYLTENSLGRLWMLNRPDSELPKDMPYFVKPDEDAETEFKKISSPENITVVDPACGSGHILVYAFELLSKMYLEDGYTGRDAARLILEKNLSGMEIDPRAGAMASFALTMKACELDSRFLRRGVSPRITVLNRVEFEPEELQYVENLRNRPELMDAAAHLDECGSLLTVSSDDLEAIARDLASLADETTIFGGSAAEKLERLRAELEPLSRRYDAVVANPPYMGSSSLGKWMGSWVKKHYPEAYRDLCTSFIDRGFGMSADDGCSAMVTMQSWMFLGSFEKLRGKILRKHSISSMAHLGTRAFGAIGGEVVSTTATVFSNAKTEVKGSYFRLVDMGSEEEKQAGLLEALANPDCGWFYRCSERRYNDIPGTPIVYWASKAITSAFKKGLPISSIGQPRQGLATGENARFVRQWWEVSLDREWFDCPSIEESVKSGLKWFPYNKGGEYRKWYGNNDCVVNWENNGYEIRNYVDAAGRQLSRPQNTSCYFKPCITWSKISSGSIAFRYKPAGHVFDVAGTSIFANSERLSYLQGACNSSAILKIANMLSPTLNFEVGQIAVYPIVFSENRHSNVNTIVEECRLLSRSDWDSVEVSWDFSHHPLI
ncbi:BREX-1 system adenine-specific DNA-methyltransferase PglX, partial [Slackia isoflavoniconvertens]|uniref:BREX-1 system adenine-specific DNA-methyltransferase PglX n=1 Tax=Slackia isoflavoniconvertens TaxID=572010 RepID=UPI003A979CFB